MSGSDGSSRRRRSYKKKPWPKRIKKLKRLTLVVTFLFLLGWALSPSMRIWAQSEEIQELQSRIQGVRGENQGLRQELARLNSDEYLEMLARRDLGLIRPGEHTYFILPPPPPTAALEPVVPLPPPTAAERRIHGLVDSVLNRLGVNTAP